MPLWSFDSFYSYRLGDNACLTYTANRVEPLHEDRCVPHSFNLPSWDRLFWSKVVGPWTPRELLRLFAMRCKHFSVDCLSIDLCNTVNSVCVRLITMPSWVVFDGFSIHVSWPLLLWWARLQNRVSRPMFSVTITTVRRVCLPALRWIDCFPVHGSGL